MLLSCLMDWQPFRIDALGLVTLLGAEQVNKALGCFVTYPISDYLPLLAAFVVAGDSFTEPIPGFQLYNITDGIVAHDISGWFARWLLMQELPWNSTYLSIHFNEGSRLRSARVLSLTVGMIVNGTLLAIAVLMADWWGVANAAALIISVVVRQYLLHERAKGLRRNWRCKSSEKWATASVKCLVLTPAGKAITLYAPRGIVTEVLLTEPKVNTRNLYQPMRVVGWIVFGCHVIALGMASLVTQMMTVAVLILSTWSTIYAIGTDHSIVAGRLKLDRHDENTNMESRSRVYMRLDLSAEEEDTLVDWCLMPPRRKQDWWTRYRGRTDSDRHGFEKWKLSLDNACTP